MGKEISQISILCLAKHQIYIDSLVESSMGFEAFSTLHCLYLSTRSRIYPVGGSHFRPDFGVRLLCLGTSAHAERTFAKTKLEYSREPGYNLRIGISMFILAFAIDLGLSWNKFSCCYGRDCLKLPKRVNG